MILGLDLSLSSTGYCVMDDSQKIVDIGKITTKSKLSFLERCEIISSTIEKIIVKHKISQVAIENIFKGLNSRTLIVLATLKGYVMKMCVSHNCPIKHDNDMLAVSMRKTVLGNGAAKKEQAAEYIMSIYSDDEKVQALGPFDDKDGKNKNSDIYDAIFISVAYFKITNGAD